MRLYADLNSLGSAAGPSGAAYAALVRAGRPPSVDFLSAESLDRVLPAPTPPPVLVTDAGEVVAGLAAILTWIERDPA